MAEKELIPHANDFLGSATTQVFLNQLLLSMVIKQGGEVEMPVHLIDDTGGYLLMMKIDQARQVFILTARKKT